MAKSVFVLAISATIVACNSNPTSPQGEHSAATGNINNSYVALAGAYSDTLPCADCPGMITDLILYPDTTFQLRERKIATEGRSVKSESSEGAWSISEDGKKVKLTSMKDGGNTRTFAIGDKALLQTEAPTGVNTQDLSLDLTEQIAGKIGVDYLMYKTSAFTKYPVQVFSYIMGNNIHIHKGFLDTAGDAEKAVVLFYALQFDTGCDENGCALLKAMNVTKEQAEALVKKWMPTTTINNVSNGRGKDAQRLALLFFVKNGDQLQVNYNLMTQDKVMSSSVDDFQLKAEEVVQVHKGEIHVQDRSSKVTSGGMKLQNPKKAAEK